MDRILDKTYCALGRDAEIKTDEIVTTLLHYFIYLFFWGGGGGEVKQIMLYILAF